MDISAPVPHPLTIFQAFLKQQILIESKKQKSKVQKKFFKSLLFVCFGWIRGQG
jgi:hypothetical protein